MNSGHSRAIANTCERNQNKLQMIAEMLLLSCEARPLRSCFSSHIVSPSYLHEKISDTVKTIMTLMKAILAHVHMISTKWLEICEGLQELSSTTINLIELCSHTAYLVAVDFPGCELAEDGLVDKYSMLLSGLEIKMSCNRLKRARIEDLTPQLIIDLCSNISRHIAIITDICRLAGESVDEESTSDQFKLCVKSVTCAAGCLIASIKSYKSHPSTTHHSRVIVFCEPVLAASAALVSFATEDDFTGKQALLTSKAIDVQKTILGSCMSVVSACIQLCKTVRDLVYDVMKPQHREKLHMCTSSVERASIRLHDILDQHSINERALELCKEKNKENHKEMKGEGDDSYHSDSASTSTVSGSETSGNSTASR
ncbi:talin rod domain-containing protein 1-like [Ylistrum balloti]|uniref:talin rod domain-containing protein 1-like n=1 Tax=Ylistrum balloti TaxID=509963 RepID=UPI002905DB13|nr:talin rod domain-containing protein 1-like [Ylistrum balloti]